MSVFDQRGQRVNYQFNAAGDISFGNVRSKASVLTELQKLEGEVKRAVQAGALDEEVAVDVKSNLEKATLQAQKVNPDKKVLLDYIEQAKKLLEGISSMTGLVAALTEAAKAIGAFF
jgi:hypothetical protein